MVILWGRLGHPIKRWTCTYPHTWTLDSSIHYVGEVTAVFMISHTYLFDVIVRVTLKGWWFTQKWKFRHLLTLVLLQLHVNVDIHTSRVWACLHLCTTILNVYSHLWVCMCIVCACACVCVLYGSLIAVVFNGFRKPIRPSLINPLSLSPSISPALSAVLHISLQSSPNYGL